MSLGTDLLKVADLFVGRPLAVLLAPVARLAARRAAATDPERVLVIRPGGIGDAVLFIPLLQHLADAWPGAVIDVLCERRNHGIVAGLPLVGEALRYDRPAELVRALGRRYDVVIDTEQYHALSAVVAALTRAPRRIGFGTNARRMLFTDVVPYSQEAYEARSFLGLAAAATGRAPGWQPDATFFPVAPQAREWAAHELAPLAPLRRVGIHPGASIAERRWPVERYAELARQLAADGLGIVILGGAGDVPAAAVIESAVGDAPHVNVAGRTNLQQIAAVVAELDVYVSADTGPLHIAYAVGTPTVHFFGAGVLSKWGPPGQRFTTIRADVPCSPCTVYGYTPPCCQGLVCMTSIDAGRVRQAVLETLAADRA